MTNTCLACSHKQYHASLRYFFLFGRYVTVRLKEVNDSPMGRIYRFDQLWFARVETDVPSRAETALTYGVCQEVNPLIDSGLD